MATRQEYLAKNAPGKELVGVAENKPYHLPSDQVNIGLRVTLIGLHKHQIRELVADKRELGKERRGIVGGGDEVEVGLMYEEVLAAVR